MLLVEGVGPLLAGQGMQQRAERRAMLAGEVLTAGGKTVAGAAVQLELQGWAKARHTLTDAGGHFQFAAVPPGTYTLCALATGDEANSSSITVAAVESKEAASRATHLVLRLRTAQVAVPEKPGSPGRSLESPGRSMDFSDEPDFAVAGVTDWTAVGGHGSDATLRTSEDLTRETVTLQPGSEGGDRSPAMQPAAAERTEARLRDALAAAPGSFALRRELGEYYVAKNAFKAAVPLLETASRLEPKDAATHYDLALALRGTGDLTGAREQVRRALALSDAASYHRLAGELEEALADPLAAVRQYQLATELDPNEANYLAWGSELLLHRAIWPAGEVLARGAAAHPLSVRLKTAWGAALFSGALYDEAAQRLCEATDLDPGYPDAYVFLGKAALASPTVLPCVAQRLARHVQQQPKDARAHYFYAMSLLRESAPDVPAARAQLQKAVTLDPKLAEAFLQLGILAAGAKDYDEAIDLYTKAIAADPQGSEAHYRLAMVYDRTGRAAEAKQELARHEALQKVQAAMVEQGRQSLKQFQIVTEGATRPASEP